jgi:hypothetical protein
MNAVDIYNQETDLVALSQGKLDRSSEDSVDLNPAVKPDVTHNRDTVSAVLTAKYFGGNRSNQSGGKVNKNENSAAIAAQKDHSGLYKKVKPVRKEPKPKN